MKVFPWKLCATPLHAHFRRTQTPFILIEFILSRADHPNAREGVPGSLAFGILEPAGLKPLDRWRDRRIEQALPVVWNTSA